MVLKDGFLSYGLLQRINPSNNLLPSRREACTPHRDIREDAVSEALFAVNLSHAICNDGVLCHKVTQQNHMERIQAREVLIIRHEDRRVMAMCKASARQVVQGASWEEVNQRRRFEISRGVNRPAWLCAVANPPGRSRNRNWR